MYISTKKIEEARAIFRKHGGILKTSEAMKRGIHPSTIYYMRDNNIVERLSRGVFRLSELPPIINPDIVSVASQVPACVICLISALSYHEITTEIPHAVHIAISRKNRYPRISYPPTKVYMFSDKAFQFGIEIHNISGMKVKIYSQEKTIADCFKYRNKLGLDVALEALKLWRKRKGTSIKKLVDCAKVCRVYNVMKPYIEAML